MKVSRIKDVKRFKEEGAWVDFIPDLPDVKVKVRSLQNEKARKAYAEARLEMSEEEWKNDQVQDELDIRITCDHVLLDWDGIEDDSQEPDKEGKYPPLPFDPELAKQLLADPSMSELRQGIRWAASNVGFFGKDRLEKATKN